METKQSKQAKRRKHSAEFRAGAVRLVVQGGRGISDVAHSLDVHRSLLSSWVRQARIDSEKGSSGPLTTSEREEFARLKKEVRELRLEREILKKAAAFFAKENA